MTPKSVINISIINIIKGQFFFISTFRFNIFKTNKYFKIKGISLLTIHHFLTG